jgi:hypothetical protein
MRRASWKSGLMVMMLGGLLVLGCGDADFLDEMGQRYTASMEIEEVFGETLAIDVVRDICSFDEASGVATLEEFGPVSANITVAVNSGAPGITLKNYTIEYLPLPSALGIDGTGDLVMPPALSGPLYGEYSIDIPSEGSATFSITLMSTETKLEYLLEVLLAEPDLEMSRYNIRVRLNFEDEYGGDRQIVINRTVWFYNVANC